MKDLMFLSCLLAVVPQLFATTWYVNISTGNDSWSGTSEVFESGTTGPFKTLQKGVSSLKDGDTLYVAPGTYEPAKSVYHGQPSWAWSIIGTGTAENPVVIDGGGTNRCFTFDNANKYGVVIKGLTFRNGSTTGNGGGILFGNARAKLIEGCTFENCVAKDASNGGGAIWMKGKTDLVNCRFTGCQATKQGGAVHHASIVGTVYYSNCVFNACSAGETAGAIFGGYSEGELATNGHWLVACAFTNCTSAAWAGAMWTLVQRAEGCTFSQCSAGTSGGAYFLDAYAGKGGLAGNYNLTNTFVGCVFDRNSAGGVGGCLAWAYTKRFSFSNCTFTANTSIGNGAILASSGQLALIDSCTFASNAVLSAGKGGILGVAVRQNMRNCLFEGNKTGNDCILKNNTGGLVDGCRFIGNDGPIYDSAGYTNCLRNCLFANNVSTNDSTGRLIRYEWQWGAGFHMDNCTFVGNRAAHSIAGTTTTLRGGSLARVANCVFFGNDAPKDLNGDFENPATNCWFETGRTTNPARHIVGTDPRFADLARGDCTPRRHSPLRNAGLLLDWLADDSTDCLGSPRVNGDRPDLGAIECWIPAPGILLFIR